MIEHYDECDPHTPLCISFGNSVFFSGDAFHQYPVGTMLIQYSINQIIHSELVCDALDFDVIV
jgi:hypothetical protein